MVVFVRVELLFILPPSGVRSRSCHDRNIVLQQAPVIVLLFVLLAMTQASP